MKGMPDILGTAGLLGITVSDLGLRVSGLGFRV